MSDWSEQLLQPHVLASIARSLDPDDLLALSCVNRRFERALADATPVWFAQFRDLTIASVLTIAIAMLL